MIDDLSNKNIREALVEITKAAILYLNNNYPTIIAHSIFDQKSMYILLTTIKHITQLSN